MQMPQHVLKLTAHLRDFLADIERGRRPDWNTIERASFKFCTLKLHLHALPKHEALVGTPQADHVAVSCCAEPHHLIPPPDDRRHPNNPPSARFEWHDGPDYPAHESGASPPLDPGNE